MRGIIFDIQRFSINDGPGIRTTVFLKGCPLNCLWCHNPESKKHIPQLSYDDRNCAYCGKCQAVCKNGVHKAIQGRHDVKFQNCIACGTCISACPQNCLSIYGREVDVEEVMSIVLKDKKYYGNSGGGLTISGGEPMSQFDFANGIAKEAKKQSIPVAIETSGFGNRADFESITDNVDLFLFDYKATGDELHKKLTGVDRRTIESNFNALVKRGAKMILRCPIIPNYNLTEDHLHEIARIGMSYDNIEMVEILPYHNFGTGKGRKLGEVYTTLDTHMPSDDEVDSLIKELKGMGLNKIRRG